MSENDRPRSASRLDSAAPSSSEVELRTVAKRQCSSIAPPSETAPKCVCVLPTSTTRSTCGLCVHAQRRAVPANTLVEGQHGERVGQPLARRRAQLEVELEQRDQHEAPREDLLVRDVEGVRVVFDIAEQQQVDVNRPRTVPGAAGGAAEVALELLAEGEQLKRTELGVDREAGVKKRRLVEDLTDRVGVVDARARDHANAALREGV